jgi:uncharacterized pyridoxamine 5'-phosphate oxidase family protein
MGAMDYQKSFLEVMNFARYIALATSVDDIPNVRLVDFCYLPETPGVIYFGTFRDSTKAQEMEKNTTVSLTTIPVGDGSPGNVRVTGARVERLKSRDAKVDECYFRKFPELKEWIQTLGEKSVVYAARFQKAHVTVGMEHGSDITF